ncbi:tRNA(adenine34) deaminase, variant 2 [Entomophthora muscae]|uniref:tRNA(Adenine34) deaminase, variant 2 n=1 Tax=Entomophthora muscae TaxID=34485 RepID=A0ACC2THR8_9FUNG|nr:tRNA(adenine34) deaminase, variant 2 [Entomophthora muscae]
MNLNQAKILEYMKLAFEQAEEAYNVGEVPVGCVIVDKTTGKVVSGGRNETNETLNGTRHAELVAYDKMFPALKEATESGLITLENYMLFVTVEPCIMCASALGYLKIDSVYYGCQNERFGGCGSVESLHESLSIQQRSYAAFGGYMREEAIMMLRRFYVRENTSAPAPKKKAARVLKTEIAPPKKASE